MSDESNWFNDENFHDYNMDVQGEGDEGSQSQLCGEQFLILVGEELTQADQTNSWVVIGSFFDEKGLVRQQLDSFNLFIQQTIQDLVSHRTIELRVQDQYKPGSEREDIERAVCYD